MSAAPMRLAGVPFLRGDRSEARNAPPLGQILCDRGLLADADLDLALAEQLAVGGRLGEVLTARGLARPDDIASALAEQWGLGAADLGREPPDPTAGDLASLDIYLRHSIVPWRRIGKLDVYATSEPAGAGVALGRLGKPLALVTVAPRAAVDQALLDRFGPALAERAAQRTPPELSVRTLGTARALTVIALAILAGGAGVLDRADDGRCRGRSAAGQRHDDADARLAAAGRLAPARPGVAAARHRGAGRPPAAAAHLAAGAAL